MADAPRLCLNMPQCCACFTTACISNSCFSQIKTSLLDWNCLTLCPEQTRFYLHFEQRLLQRCVKVFLLQTGSWQHLKCHSKPDSHLAVHKHRMQPLTPKLPQVLRKFFAAIQDVNVAILPAPVALRDSVNTSVITVSTRLGSKAVITARLWRPFMKTLCYVANTLSNHTRFEEVCRHSFC